MNVTKTVFNKFDNKFIFVYFYQKAKLDAKFAALERFEDMDDSLSSISTVSDESDLDSGIDPWVSKLASLSEVEEEDYEVIPRISWDELYSLENETISSQSTSNNGDYESSNGDNEINISGENNEGVLNRNDEMLSRDDWDRILKTNSVPTLDTRPRNHSGLSGNTLCESNAENGGRLSTICDDATNESTWANAGTVHKNIQRTKSNQESKKIEKPSKISRSISTPAAKEYSNERTSSWVSNLFRRKSSSVASNEAENKITAAERLIDDTKVIEGNLVVIPEVEEVRIEEKDVSRSFDDNCDFERAEECEEENDNS